MAGDRPAPGFSVFPRYNSRSAPIGGCRALMPVNLKPPDPKQLLPVKGVALGVTEAGIRKAARKDLLVMRLDPGARVAGVFTQNRFCAAPVVVARQHLSMIDPGTSIRALVVNTGNAN